MTMTRLTTKYSMRSLGVACAALAVLLTSAPARAVTITTTLVGNAGNGPDPNTGNQFGNVSSEYRIGTTEVTNAQYAEFLNTKAASDPLGLYNSFAGISARGGITRSGIDGTFTYATKTNMADKPVNVVTWYSAIRFANWLHNGQGAGDTESGAYTLLGGTPTPSNGDSITRNGGANWFLTSKNEWYKAAYHQPQAQGGDVDNYWHYPTATNDAPTEATANATGDIDNPGVNVANFNRGADWNSQNGNVTTVGGAGLASASFYGTFDQGGNVAEWNETFLGGTRGLQGGAFDDVANSLSVFGGDFFGPFDSSENIGFRVATVPEPSTAVLCIAGGGVAWVLRRRFM